MRAALIALMFLTCTAESCQHDSTLQSGKVVKAPELDANSAWAGLVIPVIAVLIMLGRKHK